MGTAAAPQKTGADGEDYLIDHSSYIYLMDPQGRFVRGFDADTPSDEIAYKVRLLME
jgi:protein SCO1/2